MAKASEGCGTMVAGEMRDRINRYLRVKNTCGAQVQGDHRDATDRLAEKPLEIIGNIS